MTSATPRTSPPTTAPLNDPMPPITMATNALSTGARPIVGSTAPPVRARMRTAPIPASNPEMRNALDTIRFARTPSSRAVWKFSAAPLIASPKFVRLRMRTMASRAIEVTSTVTTW